MGLRIGIDVGGTNTDAVLIDGAQIRASVKTPTTKDVTSGVRHALAELMASDGERARQASAVMIGTTHFVNAVVQRQRLNRAAAIRICLPACASLPPFVDWPSELAHQVNAGTYLVGGGHEFDGRALAPMDELAIAAAARAIRKAGVTSVAIAAVFSPLTDACEQRGAEIVANEHPDARITLSTSLGRIGLLERENVTLLNAALLDLAAETTDAFAHALNDSDLSAKLFVTQNDGTVAPAELARKFPVFSFASGPTNSMRGAMFLSGVKDGLVCDIGGTTMDVGCLRNGFPRQANNVVEVGGVRTLFRMPEVMSVGLGGGSIVTGDCLGDAAQSASPASVGPESVGYRITDAALVFGGDTLTCTDIAVAAGLADIGDRRKVARLDGQFVQRTMDYIHARISSVVDRMKMDATAVPLLSVGGGAMLAPDQMEGVSEVVRVEHHGVANAVGAAIAQVCGEVDNIFHDMDRDALLDHAVGVAKDNAVAAGADPDSLEVVDMEDLPLAYMPGNAVRVRVRVIGDIASV
ncbi:MAG: hydantoinase/oxoprolinase family protein [Chromatiales bacterium]|nr:hydantoinase/oxoprolinase family protein [Chromatiales bacterium]